MRSARLLIAGLTFFLAAAPLYAEKTSVLPCKFKYWEVIPHEKLKGCFFYHLPDFSFRPVESTEGGVKERFCNRYQVRTKRRSQELSYCYTGAGDRDGPTFELDGVFYLADLHFSGCVAGRKVEGVLFGKGGWDAAPNIIERYWPYAQNFKGPRCRREGLTSDTLPASQE